MAVKQQIVLICDYCKTVQTVQVPATPDQVSDWIEARVMLEQPGPEEHQVQLVPGQLNFCGAKCAGQAFKNIAAERAAIINVEPLESKVREKVTISEEGEVSPVAQ